MRREDRSMSVLSEHYPSFLPFSLPTSFKHASHLPAILENSRQDNLFLFHAPLKLFKQAFLFNIENDFKNLIKPMSFTGSNDICISLTKKKKHFCFFKIET